MSHPPVDSDLVSAILDRIWVEYKDKLDTISDEEIVGAATEAAYAENHARWTIPYRRALILEVKRKAEWKRWREKNA